MHPVRMYTYLPDQKLCIHADGTREKLEYIASYPNQLAYEVRFDETRYPKLWTRESHVLPELGLEISRFGYRKQVEWEGFDYYIDIARVAEQGERWVVRDLYLDVLVFNGVRAEILDTDEYLAALHEGHLGAEEAAYALLKLHALVDGLGACGYDLGRYLAAQGVTLTWHR